MYIQVYFISFDYFLYSGVQVVFYVYIYVYIVLSCYLAILLYKLLFLIRFFLKTAYYLATILHYLARKKTKTWLKNIQNKGKT